jgi:hypothetical protein
VTEKEITDFIMVTDSDPYRFQTEIKRLLAEGYSVYGEIAHGYTEDSVGRSIYSRQALVKYKIWEQ